MMRISQICSKNKKWYLHVAWAFVQATDLIPRMLVVDPMKRMTIPEIRQHPFFTMALPLYLTVRPRHAIPQLSNVNEAIVKQICNLEIAKNIMENELRMHTKR